MNIFERLLVSLPKCFKTAAALFLMIQRLSNLCWAQWGCVSSGVPWGHAGVYRDMANDLGLDGHKSQVWWLVLAFSGAKCLAGLTWASSPSVPREWKEKLQDLWGLGLEVTQYHFCHIVLVKVNHKPIPAQGCGSRFYLWMEAEKTSGHFKSHTTILTILLVLRL